MIIGLLTNFPSTYLRHSRHSLPSIMQSHTCTVSGSLSFRCDSILLKSYQQPNHSPLSLASGVTCPSSECVTHCIHSRAYGCVLGAKCNDSLSVKCGYSNSSVKLDDSILSGKMGRFNIIWQMERLNYYANLSDIQIMHGLYSCISCIDIMHDLYGCISCIWIEHWVLCLLKKNWVLSLFLSYIWVINISK